MPLDPSIPPIPGPEGRLLDRLSRMDAEYGPAARLMPGGASPSVPVVDALPDPGRQGRVVMLQATSMVYFDDGTSWIPIGPPYWISAMPDSGTISVTPTANVAYLMPIPGVYGLPFLVARFRHRVTTQAGNMDLGLYYTDDESTFTRIISTGSIAVPAAGTYDQALTASLLTPTAGRRFFAALAGNNGTAAWRGGDAGLLPTYQKTLSFPLPESLTGMSAGPTNNPLVAVGP